MREKKLINFYFIISIYPIIAVSYNYHQLVNLFYFGLLKEQNEKSSATKEKGRKFTFKKTDQIN